MTILISKTATAMLQRSIEEVNNLGYEDETSADRTKLIVAHAELSGRLAIAEAIRQIAKEIKEIRRDYDDQT